MRGRRAIAVAAVTGALMMTGVSAQAANPPEPVRLIPVDGAHWEAEAGLPASQILVQDIGTSTPPDPVHVGVAAVAGLEGEPTSNVSVLGFAVGELPGGIIPCVRVGYTDPDGNPTELMLHPLDERTGQTGADWTATPSRTGWTTYTYTGELPEGTITGLEVQVAVEVQPPDPVRVEFDNVQVNTKVWTSAANNSV